MTTPSRLERNLPGILGDLAAGPSPDYLDDVFATTGRTRQRPAWTFPERWLPMADIARTRASVPTAPWRMIALALVVLALIVTAALIYVGSHHPVPAPFGPARNGLIPYALNGDLYLGDPVTGQTRPLVSSTDTESGAITSPDGTRVVFARDYTGANATDVFVIDTDGSNLHKITIAPIEQLIWGGWTPDGRQVALIHEVHATSNQCPTIQCVVGQLDLVDADGSGHTVTIATVPGLSYVQFRPPQGHELLYRALVGGKWGLFAMDAAGQNSHVVVPPTVPPEMDATFANAAYSADGSRVFFDMYTSDASFGEPGCCQLFVVNADGTDLHKFIPNDGTGTWDGEASVSPDGTKVAFWHNLPDRANQVTIVNADGTGRPIATGPALNGGAHWIWAPDSSSILMFPNDAQTGVGYLLDPNGGSWRQLPWRSTGDLDWQRLALQ
jgi:Tol biopolymer transport system component